MTVSVFIGTSVDGFIARLNGDLDFFKVPCIPYTPEEQKVWSGKRGMIPQPPGWHPGALPIELLPH